MAPRGQTTRPTTDRVREALFSILGEPPARAQVLDIFAGAGSLGLEALSRGADRCVFIDHHRSAVRAIRDNLRSLDWTARATVHTGDALKAVAQFGRRGDRYTWIFADPPYATSLAADIVKAVAEHGLLADDGVLVVEHDRRVQLPSAAGTLENTGERRYGDTALSFFGTVQDTAGTDTAGEPP